MTQILNAGPIPGCWPPVACSPSRAAPEVGPEGARRYSLAQRLLRAPLKSAVVAAVPLPSWWQQRDAEPDRLRECPVTTGALRGSSLAATWLVQCTGCSTARSGRTVRHRRPSLDTATVSSFVRLKATRPPPEEETL